MQTDHQGDGLGESLAEGYRQLVAIMFTDIVGFTAFTQSNEGLALDLLDEHRKLLRPILSAHGGKEIKTIGDSFMVEFQSALDGVMCAIKLQQLMSQRNSGSTSTRQIQLRVGIHVGDVVKSGNDVYGDTVNLAQRIESICEPGDIAMSAQVYDQVRNKISFPIQKMEERMLKNVATPTSIYRIHLDQKPVRSATDIQPRFAVLPLTNMGESDEYLADGLTEELISAFSRKTQNCTGYLVHRD